MLLAVFFWGSRASLWRCVPIWRSVWHISWLVSSNSITGFFEISVKGGLCAHIVDFSPVFWLVHKLFDWILTRSKCRLHFLKAPVPVGFSDLFSGPLPLDPLFIMSSTVEFWLCSLI